MKRSRPAIVLAVTVAGAIIGLASGAIPASAARSSPGNAPGTVGGSGPPTKVALCQAGQHIRVDGPWGDYVIKNNDFHPGRAPECITHYKRGPDFQVTMSKAGSDSDESDAYPNIFEGCSWGTCSARSPLPARLSKLKNPWVSWNGHVEHSGKWNENVDMWLGKYPRKRGQITGAEVMLWQDVRGFGAVTTTVRLDGIRWHVVHWTTRSLVHPQTTWPLIIIRAVQSRSVLHRLKLSAFFRYLARVRLINSRDYLESIHAGFEIWRGGNKMRTTWFRVHTGLRR